MRCIYLDNAATTQVAPEVVESMVRCLRDEYGNPSSAHGLGARAARLLAEARAQLLAALGDDGSLGDLLWTSGGTEADALGVAGAARARRNGSVLVTTIEHSAVLGAAQLLASEGFSVKAIPVSPDGVVVLEKAASLVDESTAVVACMLVNNELGTVQPVAELARIARASRPDIHVHCDAVQALGKIPIDAHTLGVDTLAVSAHKIHGPKGVGALWVRKGAKLRPLFSLGSQQQQKGLRPGTENVPGIVGFGEAIVLEQQHQREHQHEREHEQRQQHEQKQERACHLASMRDRLAEAVLNAIPACKVNGARALRAPHILSLALPRIKAQPLLHALEARGVFVSAGSACTSRKQSKSHVLKAIGLPDGYGTIRVSLSRHTTENDVAEAADAIVTEYRALAQYSGLR
ncbi:MAG: cysteine desulfurase family protein [Pseudomonadota bacterium]